jgi:hypothetical protein
MIGTSMSRACMLTVLALAAPLAAAPPDSGGGSPLCHDAPEATVAAAKTPAVAAFETLQGLAGTWTGTAGDGTQSFPTQIEYRLASGGSVVMETLFGGTSHEMISMYHLDGDALVMTHYCAMGNQPRMRLDAAASTADRLVFAFDGGTNLDAQRDPHVHNGEIRLNADRSIAAAWDFYANGKREGTKQFTVTRKAK